MEVKHSHKAIHTEDCDGTKKVSAFVFTNDGRGMKAVELEQDCGDNWLVLYHHYRPHFFKAGDCLRELFRTDTEILKAAYESNFDEELEAFRAIPKWDGEDYVYSISFFGANNWIYCHKTPLEKVTELWMDEEAKEAADIANQVDSTLMMNAIRQRNLEYLKDNDFFSKRANQYILEGRDLYKLIDTVNKKLRTHGTN